MPGPPPKDSKLRQRRNKKSTRAVLTATPGTHQWGTKAPLLPPRNPPQAPWHPETVDYWKALWASPQAAKYQKVHVPGLVMVFKLIDRFNYGEVNLAAEIRLERACFGVTPLDEMRLEWSLRDDQGEVEERPEVGGTRRQIRTRRGGQDPRRILQVVK